MSPLTIIKGFLSANGLVVALVAGFSVSLVSCDWKAARDARRETRAEINAKAKELTNEAVKARAPAARPGAADRLLQRQHCRDC